MTHFFSKSLSEKLQGAGCVSESDFVYPKKFDYFGEPIHDYGLARKSNPFVHQDFLIAFSLLDLIGPSEQARENARRIWGEASMSQDMGDGWVLATADMGNWHRKRHALIDLHSMPEVEAYVERSFKGEGGG